MALTGTGVQTDPYVIHDYNELREAAAKTARSGPTIYLMLGNDIDCSVNGPDWQWETLVLNGSFEFNLNGFAIKNVTLKKGNNFIQATDNTNSRIYNGKILNIYTSEGAKMIIYGNRYLKVENLSMSICWSKANETCFNSVTFKNCAIYIKADKPSGHGFFYDSSLSYSDWYVEIDGLDGCPIIGDSCPVSECRIRGTIKGSIPQYIFKSNVTDSVIELTPPDLSGEASYLFTSSVAGTVMNNELLPNTSGCIKATTAQIRDGAWLNANGFEVVEVV